MVFSVLNLLFDYCFLVSRIYLIRDNFFVSFKLIYLATSLYNKYDFFSYNINLFSLFLRLYSILFKSTLINSTVFSSDIEFRVVFFVISHIFNPCIVGVFLILKIFQSLLHSLDLPISWCLADFIYMIFIKCSISNLILYLDSSI